MEHLQHAVRGNLESSEPNKTLLTHRKFDEVVQKVSGSAHERVTFDFGGCSAIDPGSVLLFIHAARSVTRRVPRVDVTAGGKSSQAFEAIINHLHHYSMPKDERSSYEPAEGDYPLRAISSQDEMVSELEQWAECVQKSTKASAERMAEWNTHISELTTNSFQHGGSGFSGLRRVLIVGAAKSSLVQLAVLDAGSGIPAVLGPHVERKLHHGQIVRRACDERITSRCDPSNQGHGLPGLVDAVVEAEASLQIFSGSGLCHVRNGQRYCRDLTKHRPGPVAFDGTLTIITFRGSKWKS